MELLFMNIHTTYNRVKRCKYRDTTGYVNLKWRVQLTFFFFFFVFLYNFLKLWSVWEAGGRYGRKDNYS